MEFLLQEIQPFRSPFVVLGVFLLLRMIAGAGDHEVSPDVTAPYQTTRCTNLTRNTCSESCCVP